jgi:hypothetical protein
VWDLNNQENYKLLKINIVSTALHSLDNNKFLSINKLNDEEKSISICDITHVDSFPAPKPSGIGARFASFFGSPKSSAKVVPAPAPAATPAPADTPAPGLTLRRPQGGAEGGGFSRRRVPRRKNRKTRRKNKGISKKSKKSKKSRKSRK